MELAGILQHNRHLEEAGDLLANAVRLAPGDAAALYALGSVQAELQALREALDTLGRAVSLAPDQPLWLATLARVHWALGEQSPAGALLKRAKALPGADGRELQRLFDTPFGLAINRTVMVVPTVHLAPPMAVLGHAAPSLLALEAAVGAGNADPLYVQPAQQGTYPSRPDP